MEEISNTNPVETEVVTTPTNINELEPKMKLTGTVTKLELYGAFIDIGLDVNALVHISRLSTGHVNRVTDILQEGDEVKVWVEKVDPEKNQIMVTLIEPLQVDWRDLESGQVYTGTVSRLENYGAFVDIGAEREGLVHISEISHDYVKDPSEKLSVGDEVQVQVLGFNKRKRRIDLSVKNLEEKQETEEPGVISAEVMPEFEDEPEEFEEAPTAMEFAFRQAMGDDSVDEIGRHRRKKSGRKSKKRRRRRQDQEDLLDRTLHFQGEN
ncbi:MAG: S1 RNA-binding domain-containing protein [Candidatus Promineifilaceae bacterium]|nr:S1 RNA-binding domain-containing protein [Candidatus Promineifilaceae bacterium]